MYSVLKHFRLRDLLTIETVLKTETTETLSTSRRVTRFDETSMSTFTMALSLSSSKASFPFLNLSCGSATPKNRFDARRTSLGAAIRCEPGNGSLEIGSPVIVVEAPKMIKTAASVPCLRVNSGLVNPGDVGRIVSRKPKDVWAVRLAIGTYLIDAKYFKPLKLDDDDKSDNAT
ncbi:uncharacterized protein LOC116211334 [Punica granatum]|uniref:Uncharacterized protein LOC116211334 n=1 Tax=Punica granatum TaxID=22663 RepID=A0A6P8E874_PUNGR|nr:uncharacterized protein LOC116211334 [Punica granatum]